MINEKLRIADSIDGSFAAPEKLGKINEGYFSFQAMEIEPNSHKAKLQDALTARIVACWNYFLGVPTDKIPNGAPMIFPKNHLSNTQKSTSASEITDLAKSTMANRATEYDAQGGERSMAKTVAAFNAITELNLTELDGWQFMECLKMARSRQGKFKLDNFIDGTAYAALAGECASKMDSENNQ